MTAAGVQLSAALDELSDGELLEQRHVTWWLAEHVLPRSVHHRCVDDPDDSACDLIGRVERPRVLLLNTVPTSLLRRVFNPTAWGVERCLQQLQAGQTAPPLLIKADGSVIDGTHRYQAAVDAGRTQIRVLISVPRPADILRLSEPALQHAAGLLGQHADAAVRASQNGLTTYFRGLDSSELIDTAVQLLTVKQAPAAVAD